MTAELRLPALALPGLSPDSLGNYLASLGLLRVLSRRWPSTRIAWRDEVLHVVGGPPTLDELLNELVRVAGTQSESDVRNREWSQYDKAWSDAQKKGTKAKSGAPLALWQAEAPEGQIQFLEPDVAKLEQLQAALCNSTYAFHLPPDARKGRPLRQYPPTDFGWRPAEKKKAGTRSYGTSLVQDNYRCVPPESPVWWFIEGDDWTDDLRALLAQCLDRMTYFGRAETLTRIGVVGSTDDSPAPNCTLAAKRVGGAAPVLSPLKEATRDDIERTTDNPEVVKRAVPPAAQWLYAVRPPRPVSRERRRAAAHRPEPSPRSLNARRTRSISSTSARRATLRLSDHALARRCQHGAIFSQGEQPWAPGKQRASSG